jgi:hypothetical protein
VQPSLRVRLQQRWRAAVTQPDVSDVTASGLFNTQVWAERSFWRPAAAWAGIAGLLSLGAPLNMIDWRTLVLALLLVDLLWGSVWRLAGGRSRLLPMAPSTARQQVWMPYLRPESPAARIFSGDHQDLWPLAFRTGAPAVALAFLVAAVLGIEAVLLTVALVVTTVIGWTARHTAQGVPALLASLVSIGLPWLLVMRQMAPTGGDVAWAAPATLVLCWVLHHWGELRILADDRDVAAMLLLATGEIGVSILLIVMQAPLWLGGIVPLFLPTWLMVVQGNPVGRRMQPIWLLALLLSALAMGQVM